MLGRTINKTRGYLYVALFLLRLLVTTPRKTAPPSPSWHQERTAQSHCPQVHELSYRDDSLLEIESSKQPVIKELQKKINFFLPARMQSRMLKIIILELYLIIMRDFTNVQWFLIIGSICDWACFEDNFWRHIAMSCLVAYHLHLTPWGPNI